MRLLPSTGKMKIERSQISILILLATLFYHNLNFSGSIFQHDGHSEPNQANTTNGTATGQNRPAATNSANFTTRYTSVASRPQHLRYKISIVVQLSGELGNHLSKLAFGVALRERLSNDYDIDSQLVLQHQERGSKWISAMQDIQRCFPTFRDTDFSLGNSPEFSQRLQQQRDFMGADSLVFPNLISEGEIDQKLTFLDALLHSNRTASLPTIEPNANISLPFLHAQSFASWKDIDQNYDTIRQMFAFDESACCKELPTPEENVFHFRNFLAEMPRRGKQKGFEELSPHQTAKELWGHLPPGSKLAMTTRRWDDRAEAYRRAFHDNGWSVRVVANQTGFQDFCFLSNARYGLAGMARSTFVVWAGLLGNAAITRWYSINSTETTRVLGSDSVIQYDWKHLELKQRLRFVYFTPRNQTLQVGDDGM